MPSFSAAAERSTKEDFDAVIAHYSPYPYLCSLSKCRDLLKLSHRFATLLAQIVEKASKRPEHQRVFLQEMVSDSIHLIHVLFLGDARAAQFYIRSFIENFWRHLYFKDHPIEYGWLHTRNGYYITLETLRDYCKHLPISAGSARDRMGNLANYFGTLSRTVHSSNATGLVLRKDLASIILNENDVKVLRTSLSNVSKDLLLLISVVESDLFDAMTASRRSYLLSFFDIARKKVRQNALGA